MGQFSVRHHAFENLWVHGINAKDQQLLPSLGQFPICSATSPKKGRTHQ
jgi:hypothetical protein